MNNTRKKQLKVVTATAVTAICNFFSSVLHFRSYC